MEFKLFYRMAHYRFIFMEIFANYIFEMKNDKDSNSKKYYNKF